MKYTFCFILSSFYLTISAQAIEYKKLTDEGLEFLKQKNISAAIEKYQKALKIDSSLVEVNYGLGVAYLRICQEKKTDCDKSLYYLNKSIKLNGSYRNAYFNRAQCKGNMRDYQGALIDFDKAIEQNTEDADGYFCRAMIKIKLQDNQGACEDFYKSGVLGNVTGSKMFEANCGMKKKE